MVAVPVQHTVTLETEAYFRMKLSPVIIIPTGTATDKALLMMKTKRITRISPRSMKGR